MKQPEVTTHVNVTTSAQPASVYHLTMSPAFGGVSSFDVSSFDGVSSSVFGSSCDPVPITAPCARCPASLAGGAVDGPGRREATGRWKEFYAFVFCINH